MSHRYGSRLFRSSFLLFANYASSGVLGLIFWIVIGARFDATVGGALASLLSLSAIVAVLSSLGYTTSLLMFLPQSPDSREKLVQAAISRSLLVSLLLGAISLLFIWAAVPELKEQSSPLPFFVLALLVILTVSNGTILDSIFIGAFKASFALVRNMVGAVSRLALILPLLGAGMTGLLVVYSTSLLLPMALSFLVLLPIVIPGFRFRPKLRSESEIHSFSKYSQASYPADILASISMVYFPVLIASLSGLSDAGFFFICWSVGSLVFVIPSSLTVSLFAEASCPGANLRALRGEVLAYGMISILGIVLLVALLGQHLLVIFGALVTSDSHVTLLLVCASAVPMLLLKIDITELRLRSKLRSVTAVNAVVTVVSLCAAAVLLGLLGLSGVAVGWLLGQLTGLGVSRVCLARSGRTGSRSEIGC